MFDGPLEGSLAGEILPDMIKCVLQAFVKIPATVTPMATCGTSTSIGTSSDCATTFMQRAMSGWLNSTGRINRCLAALRSNIHDGDLKYTRHYVDKTD
jgi:hypothetical protein